MSTLSHLDGRAIAAGAGVAVGICLPFAIVGRLMTGDNGDPSSLIFAFFFAILAGFAVGGYVAARLAPDAPYSNGALAATAAFVAIQGVSVVVKIVQDDDISAAAIAFNAVVAYGCGLAGAAMAMRLHARSQGAGGRS